MVINPVSPKIENSAFIYADACLWMFVQLINRYQLPLKVYLKQH